MPSLDFQQEMEAAIGQLHKLANAFLTGTYEVTVVFQRTDVDEPSGLIAGSGENEYALEVLEDSVDDEDESDLVVRSR